MILIIVAVAAIVWYLIQTQQESETKRYNSQLLKVIDRVDIPQTLKPYEAAKVLNDSEAAEGGLTITIWGKWYGKSGELKPVTINSAEFSEHNKLLVIRFENDMVLEIFNPSDIQEFRTKMEVGKADKVRLKWTDNLTPEQEFFAEFHLAEGKISMTSNYAHQGSPLNRHSPDKPAILLTWPEKIGY